jgi:hypothetical protein
MNGEHKQAYSNPDRGEKTQKDGVCAGERILFLQVGASANELSSGSAQSFGDVFVNGELFEVGGVKQRKHVQGYVQRAFGIVHQVAHNHIILAEDAIAGDEPQNLVGQVGHSSESFDFLIGEARRLQDGALHNFIGIANQGAASVGTAFHGKLHALRNGHFADLLEQGHAALRIGFGFRSGIGQMLEVAGNGGAGQFVESVFLIGGEMGRVRESRSEGMRGGNAIEFVHQELNLRGRKLRNQGHEMLAGAVAVIEHGLDHRGVLAKIFAGIGEQGGQGIFAFEGIDEEFWGYGEQGFARAIGDEFIRIVAENGKNLKAFRERNVIGAGSAGGQLPFTRSAAMPQIIENFRA